LYPSLFVRVSLLFRFALGHCNCVQRSGALHLGNKKKRWALGNNAADLTRRHSAPLQRRQRRIRELGCDRRQ
jgi:hypothetical protein